MIKKIVLFFAYFAFFILALIYFTPKVSTYYLLETKIEVFDVVVSSEKLTDNGFSLSIDNANISVKSIDSANIGSAIVKVFGIYNLIDLNNITLSNTAKSFVPLHVDNVNIVYSILNPLSVRGYGVGEFGEFDANFNLLDRDLYLLLKPSKKMLINYKSSLKNLNKNDNGEYIYDKTF